MSGNREATGGTRSLSADASEAGPAQGIHDPVPGSGSAVSSEPHAHPGSAVTGAATAPSASAVGTGDAPATSVADPSAERVTVPLVGMTCAACATRIQKKVSKGAGVLDVAVNFGTERATVTYDPTTSNAGEIVALVRNAGYDARVEETELHVQGLDMAMSGVPVERQLLSRAGVVSASANVATSSVRVEYLPETVTAEDMAEAIERAGYRLAQPIDVADPVEREKVARAREYRTLLRRFWLAAALGVISMVLSMPLMMMEAGSA
ncbi:MAG TPA: cation transporter, partial [Longimicrobiales bacterium]|nr:cation transporter [Longimicrobiales bacterium]